MLKKTAAAVICLFAALIFTGCDSVFAAPGELISPPRLSGELVGLDDALEKAIGEKYEFAYPSAGDYLSSCITRDLDSDGSNEVLIFYIPESDGVVHMNLFVRENDEWQSVSDINMLSVGVDKVMFENLCGDDTEEIVVSTRLYTSSGIGNRQVLVYSFEGGGLKTRFQESCSDFTVCSMISDGYRQIIMFNMDASANTVSLSVGEAQPDAEAADYKNAAAKLVELSADGEQSVTVYGEAQLDPNAVSIAAVTEGTVGSMNAVYVDTALSTGSTTTSLLIFDSAKKLLLNPLYDAATGQNSVTLRSVSILSRDIDSDGVIEIPVSHQLADGSEKTQDLPVSWMAYDGRKLTVKTEGYYNAVYNCYFSVPERWITDVTVEPSDNGSTRTYRVYSGAQTNAGKVLCILTAKEKTASEDPSGTKTSDLSATPVYSTKKYDFYVDFPNDVPKEYSAGIQIITDTFTVLD